MNKPDDEADRRRKIAELQEMIERLPADRRAQLMNDLEEEGESSDGSLPPQ